jgi:hypothetical protein
MLLSGALEQDPAVIPPASAQTPLAQTAPYVTSRFEHKLEAVQRATSEAERRAQQALQLFVEEEREYRRLTTGRGGVPHG